MSNDMISEKNSFAEIFANLIGDTKKNNYVGLLK